MLTSHEEGHAASSFLFPSPSPPEPSPAPRRRPRGTGRVTAIADAANTPAFASSPSSFRLLSRGLHDNHPPAVLTTKPYRSAADVVVVATRGGGSAPLPRRHATRPLAPTRRSSPWSPTTSLWFSVCVCVCMLLRARGVRRRALTSLKPYPTPVATLFFFLEDHLVPEPARGKEAPPSFIAPRSRSQQYCISEDCRQPHACVPPTSVLSEIVKCSSSSSFSPFISSSQASSLSIASDGGDDGVDLDRFNDSTPTTPNLTSRRAGAKKSAAAAASAAGRGGQRKRRRRRCWWC